MKQEISKSRDRLSAPRAAALAGILFSVLILISLVLIRISIPQEPLDSGHWLSSNSNQFAMALNLVPFAGIAFRWFIAVIRDRLGEYEDRFFYHHLPWQRALVGLIGGRRPRKRTRAGALGRRTAGCQ